MGVPSVMGKRGALLKLAVSVGAWLTIRGGATCLVGTWRVRDEYWMKRGRAGHGSHRRPCLWVTYAQPSVEESEKRLGGLS